MNNQPSSRTGVRLTLSAAVCGAILFGLVAPSIASELVYAPTNPSFGGNPNYSSHLLGTANAINDYEDPDKADIKSYSQKTALERFNDSLERSILNRVASSLTSQIVDTNGNLVPGSLETSDFSILIVETEPGVLSITSTDKLTGQTTNFEVSTSY